MTEFDFFVPDVVKEALGDTELRQLIQAESKIFLDTTFNEPESTVSTANLQALNAYAATNTDSYTLTNDINLGDLSNAAQIIFTGETQKDAIRRGDHKLIDTLKKSQSNDLKPCMDHISKHGENAFVEAINDSDGKHYYICPSDIGYVWVMPQSVEPQKQSAGTSGVLANDVQTKATVSVGSYAKNTNWMGISMKTIYNIPSRGLGQRDWFLRGESGWERAVAAAAADAAAGGLMADAAIATIVGAVGALAAGVLAAIVILYLVDLFHRSYGLTLNIYNWDKSGGWNVNDWFSDNSKINDDANTGGTGQFRAAKLDKVEDSFKGPDGFPIRTTSDLASYGTYTFSNGFYLKYVVHRFKDNEIGLQGNIKNNMESYYKSSWAPPQSFTTESAIEGTGVPIKGITYALSGADERLYTFDVHIGVKQ
ncbi:pyk10-binding 1 [Diaporthe amygdali]|uniref:pyk10-binding 1 n=1 Tax=Phomopsis amygdali TaxID=1214568 RepID=UPI0022FDEFEB|nr:pyk10-binding 1 [Diaporthe amygdali]KAJ0115558.1 pyk10-binding 1 [Diaporthe amygdali]